MAVKKKKIREGGGGGGAKSEDHGLKRHSTPMYACMYLHRE